MRGTFDINAITTGSTAAFHAAHPDRVEAFLKVRMAELPTLETYLRHVIGRADSDVSSRVREIAVPTLVMVGDDEDHGSTPGDTHLDFARRLARDIPGAKFVVLPGQGHHYAFYAPAETNRLIREFLAGT